MNPQEQEQRDAEDRLLGALLRDFLADKINWVTAEPGYVVLDGSCGASDEQAALVNQILQEAAS